MNNIKLLCVRSGKAASASASFTFPIAVFPATREEKISFRQLRATDLSPIRYKKVAEVDLKKRLHQTRS